LRLWDGDPFYCGGIYYRRNLSDWDLGWQGPSAPFWAGFDYRRYEPISSPGDGLYETRSLGIVLQDLSDLPDRAIDAVIGVKENPFAPNPLDNLFPADELPPALQQQQENFSWDALQL